MSPFPGGKQVARARNSSTAQAGKANLGVAIESSHLSICELLQAAHDGIKRVRTFAGGHHAYDLLHVRFCFLRV